MFAELTYDENIQLTRRLYSANKRYGILLNHWDHFSRDARFRDLIMNRVAYQDANVEAREISRELVSQRH